MKIGIDIDNVIANFDDELLKEYLKYDKQLRNAGIINSTPVYLRYGMFDWSKAEEEAFYKNNIERIVKKLKPLNNSVYYIKKLKELGHEIYIITGRDNGEYSDPYKLTKDWLKKYDIIYDELLFTNAYNKQEKSKVCIENKIDLMIEDSINTCLNLISNGINVYTMNTRYNQNKKELIRVSNWKEIYKKITNSVDVKKQEKINVILDTDMYNECDDQFALSYMIKSKDIFNIEAITIAPYHHDNNISIEEGLNKSYEETIKICKWLNFDTTNKVFKGSTDYTENNYYESTEAVERIIEIANKNNKTYILAIGAITNVAIAILKCPSIIDKIEIIWLGGHSLLSKTNNEFNFRQDINGINKIFESNVKLTIIPCKNVASNLMTSIYELEHYLKGKNQLCDYLCQRFYDDKVHGLQERRIIWDISAVAYLINKNWFEIEEICCPSINKDSSYKINDSSRKITMVNYLNAKAILNDLFLKLVKDD